LSARVARYVASAALWNGSSIREGRVSVVGGVLVTVLVVDVDDDDEVVVVVSPAIDVEDLGCCAL
jgi:hypothetical protein